MKISCPSCAATLQVKDSLAGRTVNCPRCKEPMTIPEPESEELAEFLDAGGDESPNSRVTCPMCGAKNSNRTTECHACGEPLSSKTILGVWRDGKKLVMNKAATLPYRCLKTNGEADSLLPRKLYWHTPLLFVVVLFSPLIYIILALILRKKAEIQVPLCDRIRRRRFNALLAAWIVGLGGLAVMGLGIYFTGVFDPTLKDAAPLVIIGGLLGALFGVIICLMIANTVSAAKIDDKHVWLNGVHADYLAALPDWPGGK